MSLAMQEVPPGEPPRRPDPTRLQGPDRDDAVEAGAMPGPRDDSAAAAKKSEGAAATAASSTGTLWLVAPVAAAFLLTTLLTVVFVLRK